MSRPPYPPFSQTSALEKVRMAESAWNTRIPEKVALAYTEDTQWRNREIFLTGRAAVTEFLTAKWKKESEYRLAKEIWAFSENRIAVRFAYEYQSADNTWHRAYGNENWEFDANGLMHTRIASINEAQISPQERKFHWPLGERPANHPSLTELGL